ncbi:1-phosphatidylinositol 4,5-bisphosphate phosphodiesterase [Drechslerella dactyloides]|uniref:Phosphoinositide phospholipase C n=1 Tax=Drechslerella dactyloides TaxID=74499 RepID=A0AAD6IQJ5_DREDA|nr:1-phosphatidylinositol 4,5-bisphosphate phosphodiesterase [Drechslerella dactyloides]
MSSTPTPRASMIIGSPRFPSVSASAQPPASGISLPVSAVPVPPVQEQTPKQREKPSTRQASLNSFPVPPTLNATTSSSEPLRPRTYSAPVFSTLSLPPGTNAMTEALNSSSSSKPGIIRRLSRGAANKLSRRRSNSIHERDETHGPVIMRHRSNSNTSEPKPFLSNQDADESPATGLPDNVPSESRSHSAAELDEVDSIAPDEGPPEIPMLLQTGTPMTRVTKRKKTLRYFVLEKNAARITWDPLKPSARLYLDDVKEIRTGENARNYRESFQVSSDFEDRWITVIYSEHIENGRLRTLHLVAPTKELFQLWTETLEALLTYRTELMAGIATQGDKVLGNHWKLEISSQADRTNDIEERLSFEEVERLCRRLQVNCSRQYLRARFDRADEKKTGRLTFDQFQSFVRILKERTDIHRIWETVAENPQLGMREDEFLKFLKEVQKVDINIEEHRSKAIFQKLVKRSQHASKKAGLEGEPQRISIIGFTDYLQSPTYNSPLRTETELEKHLDRPLNEYFISSSHNTYLLERQVAGEASIEGYIRTLQRGCRCVEIDCWDGDDGKPVVTHGRTLTSKVLFSDVIQTISKYAFVASQYPVILSLEVHCGIEQQIVMAELLRTILGDKLIVAPLISNPIGLPSPRDLKNKILVKVKGHDDHILFSSEISDTTPGASSASIAPKAKASKDHSTTVTTSSSNSTEDSDELGTTSSGGHPNDKLRRPSQVTRKVAKELGELGVYTRGQKFKNFSLPESKRFNHVFSLAERTFINFCKDKDKKSQLEKHNLRYLMRVYPSGWRVTSRNFDPLTFWRRGVQLVALNWQTYDTGVQLNDAMFASPSDRTGYVLKPLELRSSRHLIDSASPDSTAAKLARKLVSFSVEIISAQQLPRVGKDRDCLDSYVEVEVFSADDKARGLVKGNGGIDKSGSGGMSGLGAPQRRRTKVVKGNLFAPTWNERLTFGVETRFEGLVFLRFVVYNDDGNGDKTVKASYCLKLVNAAQGYRHLPLYDMGGEQFLFSSLFVKIDIEPVRAALPVAIKQSTVGAIKSAAKSMLKLSSDILHGGASAESHGSGEK